MRREEGGRGGRGGGGDGDKGKAGRRRPVGGSTRMKKKKHLGRLAFFCFFLQAALCKSVEFNS